MSQYDRFAADWSASRQGGWSEWELLVPFLTHGVRVLDLGCGNARLRKFLTEHGVASGAYFGMDVSEELLKIARESNPSDHFFRGDFGQKLLFGADQFELVVAVASFHHLLSRAEQRTFFSEVQRVLRPGGVLFLTTWNLPKKYRWKNFGRKNWTIPFGVEKHPRTYRRVLPRELRKLAKNVGMSVESCTLERGKNYVLIAKK